MRSRSSTPSLYMRQECLQSYLTSLFGLLQSTMGPYMRLANPLPRCVVADLVDLEACAFELVVLDSRTGPLIRCVWVNPKIWAVLRYLCEHRSCVARCYHVGSSRVCHGILVCCQHSWSPPSQTPQDPRDHSSSSPSTVAKWLFHALARSLLTFQLIPTPQGHHPRSEESPI